MLAGAVVFTFAIAALLYLMLFFWLNEATHAGYALCADRAVHVRRHEPDPEGDVAAGAGAGANLAGWGHWPRE